MELSVRKGTDRFVSPGAYRQLEATLRQNHRALSDVPAVVLSCFDRSTRLLPFVLYDSMMFPAGARTIAGALYQAGFTNTRAVFQLWNPNFRPSRARLGGSPLEMLLLSSMQIHAQRAYEAIRDAWSMGEDRPLIIVGGPKAVYEPYHFWPMVDKKGRPIAPDVAVTGEAYVLLELMNVLMSYRHPGESMRQAFERARSDRALDDVPGLVFLAPNSTLVEPILIDTGLQRLVQHLDEMPHEATGLSLMEPPHRGEGLLAHSIPDSKVSSNCHIASLLVTQGCKFNCPYCPIPALNQKSWRYRSPESLAHEVRTIYERFGIKYFFGTDDNFFNHRGTAEEVLTALATTKLSSGRAIGEKIRLSTEATQFDTYKNRDLLPLARRAGMWGMWFGIEDLTAELINKGQKPEVTIELFRMLHQHKIMPMAMIMFHEGQPFYLRNSLYGLVNQIDFLRRAGAISVQCTVHTPAVGTREFEKTYQTGRVLRRLGGYAIPESKSDGNHVLVLGSAPAWKRQLMLLGAYATFYNPLNLVRAFRTSDTRLWRRRLGYQVAGMIATAWTAAKILPYTIRLLSSRFRCHAAPPPQHIVPVHYSSQAFSRIPESEELTQLVFRAREKDSVVQAVAS